MATIKSYNKRLELLRSERSSFINLWKELSDYHLAHRGRFLTSERNKGYKRNTRQFNNKARLASRTLASGMMSGITSPARPWFKLGPSDHELAEYAPVKEWLQAVQDLMYRVYSQSNTYNALHNVYGELGVFGTGPMGVYRDFENVIWCKPYTAGSYMIGTDGQDKVNTFYREFELPVSSTVTRFGIDNCSDSVQRAYRKGDSESWVKLIHAVELNDERDNSSPLARDMKFRSVYYEYETAKGETDRFLQRTGFEDFPIMAPRWEVAGEDIYATDCPGMTCLGDVKALQLGEKRKYQALDKIVDPPLQGPATLVNKAKRGLKPGEHVATNGNEQLTSIYGNWRPDLAAMTEINREVETRISHAYYEDLFLLLSMSDRRQITAREVAEKQEEKLLMLGPVLERLHAELLDPLIGRTFKIMANAGIIPPPPPEMQGQELNVEYISILAQAQRMVAVSGLERTLGFVAQISEVWPEARHKIDSQQVVDEYAESAGVNPRVIRGDQEAQDAATAEAQAKQRQAIMEQGQQGADIAKTASEADTSGENALATMLRNSGLQ